ncbi:DUF1343 domain-containing protein, partial [bacterium]
TGLLDGLGVFNGVGTTRPFFIAGARGADPERLAARLNARDLPGVWFRAGYWQPFFGGFAHETVPGVELQIYDYHVYQGVPTAVEIAVALRELAPHALRYQTALDRDWGTSVFRRALEAGDSAAQILERWSEATEAFRSAAAPYRLYA